MRCLFCCRSSSSIEPSPSSDDPGVGTVDDGIVSGVVYGSDPSVVGSSRIGSTYVRPLNVSIPTVVGRPCDAALDVARHDIETASEQNLDVATSVEATKQYLLASEIQMKRFFLIVSFIGTLGFFLIGSLHFIGHLF